MKKLVITLASLSLFTGSFAISKSEAEKLIKEYASGSNYVSKIHVCENGKYYIGELY